MSKDYNYEVGYETLQKEWEVQKKRTPRGVTLVKGGQNIYLQFKTPNKPRSKYKCACRFSIDGIHEAVRKSHLVKTQLTNLKSETEFWTWYEKEIEENSNLVDDRITFGEAIKKVEDDFWIRPDRRKKERDRSNHSHQASWYRTYGTFYKHLPENELVNLADILAVINKQKKGTRNYGYVVSAMRKLVEINKKRSIYESLAEINTTQTVFMELQSVDLESFLQWKDKVLGVTVTLDTRCDMKVRKAWMWAFSTQIVYGLRINEVFAIKNLTEPYVTKDGVSLPALNDPDNTTNLIYIGDKTNLGTTVKTGARISAPQIPPKYPNLMERLKIKTPLVPANKPKSKNSKKIADFYCAAARAKLVDWNAPFTQTHADRHLGNINGMQAGIPQEVRAMSFGHTSAMNDNNYKKRISTKTKIDLLLNSNTQAIDFVTAMTSVKKMLENDSYDRDTALALLSVIYQKDSKTLSDLL